MELKDANPNGCNVGINNPRILFCPKILEIDNFKVYFRVENP